MRFTFVDDLATAVDQGRVAATHGDVVIMGGGDVIGQALEQGLVDELRIHLAPMLLGGGRRCSNPARVRCIANAMFVRRRTRSTSPTSACRARRHTPPVLHSGAGRCTRAQRGIGKCYWPKGVRYARAWRPQITGGGCRITPGGGDR